MLVGGLSTPKDDFYRGTPILAVEVRGTQSKHYLEEKVKLYLEHDWPAVWIVHAERGEVEVLRPGAGSVVYRLGTDVPLVPELDKHGLAAVPVTAIFDDQEIAQFNDEWARGRERARSVLEVLRARRLDVTDDVRVRILASSDLASLERWLVLAATAATAEAFAKGMDRQSKKAPRPRAPP